VIRHLYSLLWMLLLGPAWLWWAWRNRRSAGPAERGRWRERLATGHYAPNACDGLLLHAASIGEGVAAVALLKELRAQAPGLNVLVTCTSFTGAQRLRAALGDGVPQAFLPFDTPGAMARLLDRVRPRVIVLMETELWPNLLAAAQARAVPVVLANARLSAKSARAYARFAPLARPMLAGLHSVLAQSAPIARRFRALGVPTDRVKVLGNVKSDLQVPEGTLEQAALWRREIGSRLVCMAASTHPGEDEALLDAWPEVLSHHPGALLVLVPRHPQRFQQVARLITQHGHALVQRSAGQVPQAAQSLWLGDTLGEMLAWFALADLAFIGGSLIPHGGHSPLEAMALGCPIVSGRHVRNFAEAYQALQRCGAVHWVEGADAGACAQALSRVLGDASLRQRMGQSGQALFQASAGAAAHSAQAVVTVAACAPGSVQRLDDGCTATWTDTAYAPALPANPLDASTWKAMGAWKDTVGGRGSAGFIDQGVHGLVLRHYRRGGLVARVLHDTYLGQTPHRSRAMREFALLMRLRHAGLPVPQPVAARMQRVGLTRYRADLLIVRIPGAMSLAERLARGDRPGRTVWMAIGETIRQLHDQGVDHVDLNAHNLLLDQHDRVWIIDFDRCAERPGQHWKAANLSRLLRSLQKLRSGQPGAGFAEADWVMLEQGYQQRPRQTAATSHSADTGRPRETP